MGIVNGLSCPVVFAREFAAAAVCLAVADAAARGPGHLHIARPSRYPYSFSLLMTSSTIASSVQSFSSKRSPQLRDGPRLCRQQLDRSVHRPLSCPGGIGYVAFPLRSILVRRPHIIGFLLNFKFLREYMDGILIIDKPAGLTSHDVVARVRHTLKTKRVGHTGTLDPFATGVMVILVGRATRLARFLDKDEKEYEAVIEFGSETDTGDLTGVRSAECGMRNEEIAEIVARTNWD
jgi:hypothetical protein